MTQSGAATSPGMCRRVLLDGAVFQTKATGVAKATRFLYDAFVAARADYSVDVAYNGQLAYEAPFGRTLRFSGLPLPNRVWRFANYTGENLRHRYHVIHFPWNGYLAGAFSRRMINIATVHDVLPLEIPNFFRCAADERNYRRTMKNTFDRTALVITDSEYSRRRIEEEFGRHNIAVVPLAPTIASLDSVSDVDIRGNDKSYFLYVGGYDMRKGIGQLVLAFNRMRVEGWTKRKLVIAGQKRFLGEEVDEAIAAGVAAGTVDELGYVPDEDLKRLYRSAIALVYPSRYEGFGLPPIEAMSQACPVITTQGTSLPEVCGDAAVYVNPEDQDALMRAMLEFEREPERAALYRTRGLRRSASFSWARSADLFARELDSVLAVGDAGES